MEAAAKAVQLLSQRILPQEPHHLSISPHWKHRPSRQHPDESNVRRLQYLTFVADADRGVLLTRPDYDMREEKPAPPRDVATLSRPGGEKKKLSLSDYKKKTAGGTLVSPPEPSIAKRKDPVVAAARDPKPSRPQEPELQERDPKPVRPQEPTSQERDPRPSRPKEPTSQERDGAQEKRAPRPEPSAEMRYVIPRWAARRLTCHQAPRKTADQASSAPQTPDTEEASRRLRGWGSTPEEA